MYEDSTYGAIGSLLGFVAFIVAWGYCIVTYGFLFGLGLGWLPAFFVAVVVALLWLPIAAVILLIAIVVLR